MSIFVYNDQPVQNQFNCQNPNHGNRIMPLLVVIATMFMFIVAPASANITDNVFLDAEQMTDKKDLTFVGAAPFEQLSNTLYIASLYSEQSSADFSPNHAMAMDIYISSQKMSYRTFNNMWRNGIIINMKSAITDTQARQMAIFYETIEKTLVKAGLQFVRGDHVRFLYQPKKGLSVLLNRIELVTIESDILFPLLLGAWVGDVPPSSDFKADITGQSDNVKNRQGYLFSSTFSSLGEPTRNELIRQALLEDTLPADLEDTTASTLASATPQTLEENSTDAPTDQVSDTVPVTPTPQEKRVAAANLEKKRRLEQAKKDREALAKAQQSLQKYYLNIRSSIEGIQKYPRMALRKKLSGTVVIAIKVKSDGDFQHQLSSSSGLTILDTAAIKTVQKARDRFSKENFLKVLPDILKDDSFEFKIPLVYSYSQAQRR